MNMGSQYIVDPRMGAILGHTFDIDQMKVGYWIDNISEVALGAATAKTKLGGSQVAGTSADYILPTAARCIVAVRPKAYYVTPVTKLAGLWTLKVESADLGMKDYEVFANPVASCLGAAFTNIQDPARWWPLMQPCNGGEKVQFYGTPQIATAGGTPYMSADLLLSDTWPEGFQGASGGWKAGYGPVQMKIAGINSGGGPTGFTTIATTYTDGGVTISTPKKRLLGLYGVALDTKPTTVNPVAGQFAVNASELAVNPQRWNAEPLGPSLGAVVTQALAHISECAPLNLALRAPTTPKGTFIPDVTVGVAGNFEIGYLYVDYP
jgi:hypothetical protein